MSLSPKNGHKNQAVVRSGTSGPANKPPVYDVAVRFTKISLQDQDDISAVVADHLEFESFE